MTGTTAPAAIYVRISQDATGEGLGVERQERACRELADRQGLDVAAVFSDNSLSASTGKRRPAFEQLLADVEAGKYGAVLTWASDRLVRRPLELEGIIDRLGEVPVFTVAGGPFDLSTPAGRVNARVITTFAKFEMEQKAARTVSANDQRAAAGKPPSGPTPYGYRRENGAYVIVPAEAEVLRFMAGAVLDDRSITWVLADLAARGITTRRGGAWRHSSIHNALKTPTVAGLRVHRGEIVGPADWEPILDRATWEQVVAVLSDPARKHRAVASYMLTGIMRTPEGVPLVGRRDYKHGKTRRTYRAATGRSSVCDADEAERIVTERLLAALDDAVLPNPTHGGDLAGEVARLERELDTLADLRGREQITLSEWLAARAPLAEALTAAKAAAGAAPRRDELLDTPGAVRAAWPDLQAEDRRRVVARFVDHIELARASRGRWENLENRLRIVWRV